VRSLLRWSSNPERHWWASGTSRRSSSFGRRSLAVTLARRWSESVDV